MPDPALPPLRPERQEPEPVATGIGLCLSGGGYRAMLFHAGVLLRAAELGYLGSADRTGKHGRLGSLQRVSSVSGGSITAAVLALAWGKLQVDQPGVASRYHEHVLAPIMAFASQTTVSIGSGLWAALFSTVNKRVISVYRERLYGGATLQDLPDHPRFVINASNLQSGALWRFSKPYNRDWRVGEIPVPQDPIAVAVAASSAFPPFLSPARLGYREDQYRPGTGADLQRPPFTTGPILADGGVYDNLGLETIQKKYRTLLVSDAGGGYSAEAKVHGDWARQSYRVLDTIDNQVRALRKRTLMTWLTSRERLGSFFSIRSDLAQFPAPDKLDCPYSKTQQLAQVGTDLSEKPQALQRRLVNWGYAACDAAIRAWVEDGLPAPVDFPFPTEGV